MPTNGHELADLPMFRVGDGEYAPPPVAYTIVEIERAPSGEFEDGRYDLLQGDRPIARGAAAATIMIELRERGQCEPGKLVGMKTIDGKSCVYRQRSPAEILSGVPALVWRSDGRPAGVAVQ
jgi:hypothetical protein